MPLNNDLERILAFIVEIDKLKDVLRKTRPVGLERYENSAEHSWHACLAALMLKDFSEDPVDIDRVIKMLLIHDLGEIDAGDRLVYDEEIPATKADEEAGLRRVLEFLPENLSEEYHELWHEFELAVSPESRFARAIDRALPLLHNLHDQGHSWRRDGITAERILATNSRIRKGSAALWEALRGKLISAFDAGILGECVESVSDPDPDSATER